MPCVSTMGALCAYYLQPDNVSDISRVIEMHLPFVVVVTIIIMNMQLRVVVGICIPLHVDSVKPVGGNWHGFTR